MLKKYILVEKADFIWIEVQNEILQSMLILACAGIYLSTKVFVKNRLHYTWKTNRHTVNMVITLGNYLCNWPSKNTRLWISIFRFVPTLNNVWQPTKMKQHPFSHNLNKLCMYLISMNFIILKLREQTSALDTRAKGYPVNNKASVKLKDVLNTQKLI